ncbi:putative D,D-dipeptide ABC transporter membrane subunit DdpC [Hyphomicrobiales bacterium]|nr:putative D,D-dipeptide ABC transporter membrane subunit DdpC [Hyphomicrobiales bacterium]CAH1697310.1 putative D,D-dipeptide ABC transporter membrane subunit DdpC [Hyphomicrobiales bacterium]CAI0345496.1 putative D,D-dipeptide ABC transporter membrane subunit DdpC [Hyphomicrobiales bacterium]
MTASLAQWLTTDRPASRAQARLVRLTLSARALLANPLALVGLAIVLVLLAMALIGPYFVGSPTEQVLANRLLPPSAAHWLGTDELGRDILARIVYGSQITVRIVLTVSLIVGPFGLMIGIVAGYFGGAVDAILMRITDIFLSLPRLVLALAFVAALGTGINNAIIAIALTSWPPYARLARAETLSIRNSDFVRMAQLQGASAPRILLNHIAPLCIASVIVRLTFDMSGTILTAAGLGFLGLGAQPPQPEWGLMVAAGRQYVLDQWWVATIPGIAIFVASLGFNLLGDGLRDILDARSS